jgi:hypothetical protein
MGSRLGVTKIAAQRVDLPLAEYLQRQAAGLKRCTKCKVWQPITDFHKEAARSDGLSTVCKRCRGRKPGNGPSKPERQAKRKEGFAWCRDCKDWRPLNAMTQTGRCREHHNAFLRRRYADDAAYQAHVKQIVHRFCGKGTPAFEAGEE